jgi:hypothetical protein
MKAFHSELSAVGVLIGLLAALPAAAAPKHILISDSLVANADQWNVKRGGHWMGINKWRFGDYAVVASKSGATTGGTHTSFFKTKSESHSSHKFSFVLSNNTTDSAFVSAAHEVRTQSNPGLKVGNSVTIGGDDQVHEAERFTASIAINRDTSEAWELSIGSTDVSSLHGDYPPAQGTHASTLTHGERHIVLTPVFSKKLDESPSFKSALSLQFSPPAMGYEFIEDGQSLCAVEYFSSGISGSFKNTVWMHRSPDPRMRLVLAAAMTAVLELESAALEGPAEPAQP